MRGAARFHARELLQWLDARRWTALFLTLPLVVAIHLIAAAVTIRRSNQDPVASDQGAEMWLAATSREDLFPQRTDGVRHPLWSWIARFVYTEDNQAFFARGKWLNTALSVVFLCVLGIAVARWLDPLATANLLLLTGLGILLARATYFQPEPLYYVLFFLAGLLAWQILRGGAPLWLHALFGVLCGLAYLSKPSLAPFLAVFIAAMILRTTLLLWNSQPLMTRDWAGVLMALALAAVMLVPLAIFSSEHFGRPLFNYTRYWVWMDDFMTEAWPFQDKYPGRAQLEQLPDDEAPSFSWYFKRHGAGDAARRLFGGTREVWARFLFPEAKVPLRGFFWRPPEKRWEQPLTHRGIYLFLLGILCVVLTALGWPRLLDSLKPPGEVSCLVFAALLAAIYSLLYGWYWPIGRGDRFMGSLWIPAVFLLVWAAWTLRKYANGWLGDNAYLATHLFILASVALQVGGMLWRFLAGFYLVTRN
jgi:hypothetical protein